MTFEFSSEKLAELLDTYTQEIQKKLEAEAENSTDEPNEEEEKPSTSSKLDKLKGKK